MPTKLTMVPDNPVAMTPQPNVVEFLEQTLEEAKRGDIDGIVMLLSHPTGETSDRWATGPNFLWIRMLGCAELWKGRFIRHFEGN